MSTSIRTKALTGAAVALLTLGMAACTDTTDPAPSPSVEPAPVGPSDTGGGEGTGGTEAGGDTGSVVMPEVTGPGEVHGPEASNADERIDGEAVNFLLLGADSGDLSDGEDKTRSAHTMSASTDVERGIGM